LIHYHPSEPTLAAYAAGTLPQALAMVAATHLGQCAACRQSVSTLEAVAGALLDELPAEPLAADALDRLLLRVDQPQASSRPLLHPPMLHPDLPAPLNRLAMGRWWPIGLGVRYRPLRTAGAAWGGLLLAGPGRALPRHGHKGLELTCVLSGAFADSNGHYAAGDLSEPVSDHDRPPFVVSAEPCLCVIASEGVRLRGVLGFAQRMIGQ
jgi:putative transcriptional regulator